MSYKSNKKTSSVATNMVFLIAVW